MNIWSLLGAAIGFNLIGFGIAYGEASDKLTDFSYGATFIILSILAFLNGDHHSAQTLLLVLICLWGVRLSGFLVLRILRINRDHRFDGIREDFNKFGTLWISQAVAAWIILLPAIFVLSSHQNSFGALTLVGWIITFLGLVIESVADAQKYNFNLEPDNYGKFIRSGLWRLSRHPNYFGEIMVWAGIYIYCFDFMDFGQRFFGLASPLLITYLLLRVTGVPRLEKYADQKWGKSAEYRKYKNGARILVPLPRAAEAKSWLASIKVGPWDYEDWSAGR
ncbi:MAG TPA: DUF1295 domain-containing protein [Candidatus Saccharimonadales bacterium]|nr:DUF1295 domain-containing protein [Candidatus Saccharimonadales bacterium]